MFPFFLTELATVLQFSTLAPDENGACLIVMREGDIPLLFEFDEQIVPNKILLSSPLLGFPLDRRAEIYEISLKLNEKIEETLSVKPDEDLLYLHRRIPPEIQAGELEMLLNSFLKQVHAIQKQVEQLLTEPPKRLQVPPPPSQFFPFRA